MDKRDYIDVKVAAVKRKGEDKKIMTEARLMGYARVSSSGQNLERQLVELRKYVPEENIIVDKISGRDLNRPGYQALKGPLGLRQGDTLYIKSLDRLSRKKSDIKSELMWFKEQGIRLCILDLPTSLIALTPEQAWIQEMVNNILIEVMSSLAEQERDMIHQRQKEGIEAARKQGKAFGRPSVRKPDNWSAVYERWNAGEITAKRAMELSGLKRGTFYNLVAKERGK